jgi:hypothetical protein
LLRELFGEICTTLGVPVANLLWDMEKFYDLMMPEVVAKFGIKHHYPATELHMGMLVHTSARTIKQRKCYSKIVIPDRSIIAGCLQSVAWTRLYLYDILQEVHNDYKPVQVKTFVDDLSQFMFGTTGQVVDLMTRCAKTLKDNLEANGGRVSPTKVVLLASPTSLRKELEGTLRKAGIKVKGKSSGRDLGLDASLGRVRRLKVYKERLFKGFKRCRKIASFAKVTKKSKVLYTTGATPQMNWGVQSKGVSPTMVQKIRQGMVAASGAGSQEAARPQPLPWPLAPELTQPSNSGST